MSSSYQFGLHTNLSANELLFYVFIDETCKELGVDDVSAVAAILSGQNWIRTRAKPAGATRGTSAASILGRRYLNYDLKRRMLPTLTNKSLQTLKIFMVRNIGTFVGRTVPVVGWVIMAYNVATISARSVARYNRLAQPENRILS